MRPWVAESWEKIRLWRKTTKDNAMSGESFFPGFRASMIQARGPKIWTLKGGDGPPLLLLLGHPETQLISLCPKFTEVPHNYAVGFRRKRFQIRIGATSRFLSESSPVSVVNQLHILDVSGIEFIGR
jgi:hypothetical protein